MQRSSSRNHTLIWLKSYSLIIVFGHSDLVMLSLMNLGVWEGETAEWAQPAEGLYVWAVAEPLLPVPASVQGGAGLPATSCLHQHRSHIQPTVTFLWRGLIPAHVSRVAAGWCHLSIPCGSRSGGIGRQAAQGRVVYWHAGEPRVSTGAQIHWRNV